MYSVTCFLIVIPFTRLFLTSSVFVITFVYRPSLFEADSQLANHNLQFFICNGIKDYLLSKSKVAQPLYMDISIGMGFVGTSCSTCGVFVYVINKLSVS